MLHGWMDVGASFQFLVDAMARDWYVLAPDWRGFGRTQWCTDGYWFPDYVADLDALLDHYAPDEPARLVGHSLGGNVVCAYAGARPDRVARVVSLEGFGLPMQTAESAPDRLVKWLDALHDPPTFAPYTSLATVADRLQKNNPRMPRHQAEFLAQHWAEELPDGTARLSSDPRHKLPFPTTYRLEETLALWRRIKAPVLWVLASDSHILKWLGEDEAGLRTRAAVIGECELATVIGAGHMLHHDQPGQVAAVIEPFLAAA
jgi:pimeloyl-ACP methyl ester carboxylesterase